MCGVDGSFRHSSASQSLTVEHTTSRVKFGPLIRSCVEHSLEGTDGCVFGFARLEEAGTAPLRRDPLALPERNAMWCMRLMKGTRSPARNGRDRSHQRGSTSIASELPL